MIFRTLLAGLCTLLFATPLLSQQTPNDAYKELADLLRSGNVSRVKIIHVPVSIETRTRIKPQTLRDLSRAEIIFTKLDQGKLLNSLESSIAELKTAKITSEQEVRWGILLLDPTNRERGAIFLDASGHFAQLGETHFVVKGLVLHWVQEAIRDTFDTNLEYKIAEKSGAR